MKLENAIKKVKKEGFNVEVVENWHTKQPYMIRATHPAHNRLIEFHCNGVWKMDNNITCIRARKPHDFDEMQSDYFAGSFYRNLTQAINSVKKW
jgi:hypothetical protein